MDDLVGRRCATATEKLRAAMRTDRRRGASAQHRAPSPRAPGWPLIDDRLWLHARLGGGDPVARSAAPNPPCRCGEREGGGQAHQAVTRVHWWTGGLDTADSKGNAVRVGPQCRRDRAGTRLGSRGTGRRSVTPATRLPAGCRLEPLLARTGRGDALGAPPRVGLREHAHRPLHVVGPLLQGVRRPLAPGHREEVSTVDMDRPRERPQGIRDRMHPLLPSTTASRVSSSLLPATTRPAGLRR